MKKMEGVLTLHITKFKEELPPTSRSGGSNAKSPAVELSLVNCEHSTTTEARSEIGDFQLAARKVELSISPARTSRVQGQRISSGKIDGSPVKLKAGDDLFKKKSPLGVEDGRSLREKPVLEGQLRLTLKPLGPPPWSEQGFEVEKESRSRPMSHMAEIEDLEKVPEAPLKEVGDLILKPLGTRPWSRQLKEDGDGKKEFNSQEESSIISAGFIWLKEFSIPSDEEIRIGEGEAVEM